MSSQSFASFRFISMPCCCWLLHLCAHTLTQLPPIFFSSFCFNSTSSRKMLPWNRSFSAVDDVIHITALTENVASRYGRPNTHVHGMRCWRWWLVSHPRQLKTAPAWPAMRPQWLPFARRLRCPTKKWMLHGASSRVFVCVWSDARWNWMEDKNVFGYKRLKMEIK